MRQVWMRLVLVQFPLVLLCFTAIAMGQQSDERVPALTGLDSIHCVLPCWSQINPGGTHIDTADGVIQSMAYELTSSDEQYRVLNYVDLTGERCNISLNYRAGVVSMILLRRCPNTRLGDVLSLLGTPERIMHDTKALSFRGGRVIVHVSVPTCYHHLSLRDPINVIYLISPNDLPQRRRLMDYTPDNPIRTFAWRGLIPRTQYHAADSTFPLCG